MNILIIATSHQRFGTLGKKTGVWFNELATAYIICSDEGFKVTLASIEGGKVPLDPNSEAIYAQTEYTKAFRSNIDTLCLLSNTPSINNTNYDTFDALVLPGGYGALWDFPNHQKLKEIVSHFYKESKSILTLSQGAAGLLNIQINDKDSVESKSIIHNKMITASTREEDESQEVTKILPINLEESLINAGADFIGQQKWTENFIVDLPIISAQNPISAQDACFKFVDLLQST